MWRFILAASFFVLCSAELHRVRRQDYGAPQPSYGPAPAPFVPRPPPAPYVPAPAPPSRPSYGNQQISQPSYDDGSTNDPAKALMMLQMAVPGQPGQDYPILSAIPQTSLSCNSQQLPGYYADVDTQCQVFWVCSPGGKQDGFLCPNGTIFSQQYFTCDWWYNVRCQDSPNYYGLNSQLYQPGPQNPPQGGGFQQGGFQQGGFQQGGYQQGGYQQAPTPQYQPAPAPVRPQPSYPAPAPVRPQPSYPAPAPVRPQPSYPAPSPGGYAY